MTDIDKKYIATVWECPVCFQRNRKPWINLNCGHSTCEICIKKVVNCPQCRKTITKMVVNYALIPKEKVQKNKKKHKTFGDLGEKLKTDYIKCLKTYKEATITECFKPYNEAKLFSGTGVHISNPGGTDLHSKEIFKSIFPDLLNILKKENNDCEICIESCEDHSACFYVYWHGKKDVQIDGSDNDIDISDVW